MMKRFIAMMILLFMLGGCAMADVGVTGDKVNLRKRPGVGFEVLANVQKGTVLGDLGYIGTDRDGESWYWVEYQGEKCWISAKYAERVVSASDAPSAADSPHMALLGHWKLSEYTLVGDSETQRAAYEGASLRVCLVHDLEQGVSVQADVRLNDGVSVRRFLMPAVCERQPVTAWREELANVEAHSQSWSVRLHDPNEEDNWDFYIDLADENHLTMYWMIDASEGCLHRFAFERMSEEDADDGTVPQRWKGFDTELLPGEWDAAYGRIDTYSYEDAKAEGIESEMSFYRYEHGVWMNWKQSADTTLDGIRITAIDAMQMREPIDAPWYVDLTRFMEEDGRRAYLYLEDAQTLYLVEAYTIDGMPASDCVVYKRRPE